MNSIILHLGLPKTATTLLQEHVFDQNPDKIDYAGIKQPRTREQDSLFTEIVKCVSEDEVTFQNRKNEVVALIQQRISRLNGKKLVISEECFSLDGTCTWQDKYRRLGEVFSNFDSVHVLITTRESVSASYSYYVELYHNICSQYNDPVKFSINSNLCKIYDYKYLDNTIKKSFSQAQVSYVDFSLLKEETFIKTIVDTLNLSIDHHSSQLPNTNTKHKRSDGVMTHPKSVFSYLDNLLIVRQMRRSILLKKMLKKAAYKLRRVQAPGSRSVVPNLSQQQKQVLAQHYADSNEFLRLLTHEH